MKSGKTMILSTLVWLLVAPPAFSQAPPPGPGPRMQPGQRHERIKKRIQLLIMWRLTEVLDLDTTQAAKFFPLFHANHTQEQALHKKMREARQGLQEELKKPAPNNGRLSTLSSRVLNLRQQMQRLKHDQMKRAIGVLTPLQRAKFVMFFPRLQRQIRRMTRRPRHRGPNQRPGRFRNRPNRPQHQQPWGP